MPQIKYPMADLDKRMQLNATKRKMKTFICTNSIKSLHYAQYCEGTENELRVHRESVLVINLGITYADRHNIGIPN